MEIQPEAAADDRTAVVERLANKADAAGLAAEDLDETVHEFAASIAADVNNGGLEDQIGIWSMGLAPNTQSGKWTS